MKLTEVQRVLTFREQAFLSTYINLCTQMRANASNDFDKRLFKLMCNAVFEKFIENSSKYLDVRFAHDKSSAKKWATHPRFVGRRIISKELAAFFLTQKVNKILQAYGIGFTILELAKEFMYRSYYEMIKPRQNEPTVLMSDTDSLLF